MKEEFKKALDVKSKEAEESLRDYFSRHFDSPDIIINSVKYSLFGSGKKIRPILTRETARALGEDPQKVVPLADAIEMIHTYSLIHDDLPAMDDDELRRGKATNHLVFGEDVAILAGDALLNLAMERAMEGVPEENPADYIEAVKMLFYLSGINGMIGGQTADTRADFTSISGDDLEYIHTHKTGALICASVLCGAVPYLGTNNSALKSLFNYANAVGKAFQITDDILDVEGDAELMGKNTGSDERNNRASYVSLYGIGSAKERVDQLKEEALIALDKVDGETTFLRELADFICTRHK